MLLKRTTRGKYRYNYQGKVAGHFYVAEYTSRDVGPRGGNADIGWLLLEYSWEPPDEFNDEGEWCFDEDHRFRTLRQIERFLEGRIELMEAA